MLFEELARTSNPWWSLEAWFCWRAAFKSQNTSSSHRSISYILPIDKIQYQGDGMTATLALSDWNWVISCSSISQGMMKNTQKWLCNPNWINAKNVPKPYLHKCVSVPLLSSQKPSYINIHIFIWYVKSSLVPYMWPTLIMDLSFNNTSHGSCAHFVF